jgi:hypothetical protein
MSAEILVTVDRSTQWRQARAIETGENIPMSVHVAIPVSSLPVDVRARLVRDGGYPSRIDSLPFNSKYQYDQTLWSPYGREDVRVDADSPTVEEVVQAIVAGLERIDARKADAEARAKAKEASDRALAAEWASLPLSMRASKEGVCICMDGDKLAAGGVLKYPTDILATYAPAALEEAKERWGLLREISEGQKAKADRILLGQFLMHVPNDALIGALKRMAGSSVDVNELKNRIEDASPMAVFEDEDIEE